MNNFKKMISLTFLIFSSFSLLATSIDDLELLDQIDQLDMMDKLEFDDFLAKARECIEFNDFSCAENKIEEAAEFVNTTEDDTTLRSIKHSLAIREAEKAEEVAHEKRLQEKLRKKERRLAQEKRDFESKQRELKRNRYKQPKGSATNEWVGIVVGIADELSKNAVQQSRNNERIWRQQQAKTEADTRAWERKHNEEVRKLNEDRAELLRVSNQRKQENEQRRQQLARDRQREAESRKQQEENDHSAAKKKCKASKFPIYDEYNDWCLGLHENFGIINNSLAIPTGIEQERLHCVVGISKAEKQCKPSYDRELTNCMISADYTTGNILSKCHKNISSIYKSCVESNAKKNYRDGNCSWGGGPQKVQSK